MVAAKGWIFLPAVALLAAVVGASDTYSLKLSMTIPLPGVTGRFDHFALIENIPFPANQFDVVMCSFMIFHMSEEMRHKGIAEIHRVLKPQGRLLVLDLGLPTKALPRTIAKMLVGRMVQHDLRELVPLMEATGFSDIETAPAKFRIWGLPVLAFVRGNAQKS